VYRLEPIWTFTKHVVKMERKIPKLFHDDAHKKHCVSTNISRIWTMEYLNRISMI
jgi:hypothetical protein